MTSPDALFQAVLDATSDAVMVTDRAGIIRRANTAFTKLTGHALPALEGMNARDLFREYNDEEFCEGLWSTKERQHYESVRSKHADGKAQLHSLTMTPIRDASGEPS